MVAEGISKDVLILYTPDCTLELEKVLRLEIPI